VVLPKLTDPSAVAQWRQAANAAITAPALVAAASASSVELQPALSVVSALGALGQVAPDQMDLQAFLAKSFGWQPS